MFRVLTALLSLVLVTNAIPSVSAEERQAPSFSIRPVGVSGQYFDLTMEPGLTIALSVLLENDGTVGAEARTYAADVYTILNGGFGAELANEPPQGVTKWLDYEPEILALEPGDSVERAFNLTVPESTKPGEYITSIVIENAQPVEGEGEIAVNHVTRQVIAVAITIPGEQKPHITITGVTYESLPSYARVLVGVRNNGNVRLAPSAKVAIHDVDGVEVSTTAIVMRSFYAKTETAIEVILQKPLAPGEYSVSVALDDVEKDYSVSDPDVSMTVEPAATDEAETRAIVVDSVGVNEFRAADTNELQGVELVVGIDNPALPVQNARLTLHVSRDGQLVEDLVLGSSLSFPGGRAEFRQRYLPMSGWTSGVWTFSVTLDVVDPATGQATELSTVESETSVTVE